MSAILAIAWLQVRSAVRSRLFLALALALLAVIVGLPLAVKGDGTLIGWVKVTLDYTLGAASLILGIATLWIAGGSVAQEIEGRQIQMVVVKPVHRFQVWIGKWLGLVLMNALLLAFCGSVAWALVRWQTTSPSAPEKERRAVEERILTGRLCSRPETRPVEQEVRERLRPLLARAAAGKDDAPRDIETLRADLRRDIVRERSVVPAGATRTWAFRLVLDPKAAGDLQVRYRVAPAARSEKPLDGTWIVGTDRAPALFTLPTRTVLMGLNEFSFHVPAEALSPIVGPAGGATRLLVSFRNGPPDRSPTLVFNPDSGIAILTPQSGFESNLARLLLIILCAMAFLAALGLSAGTAFSFPVAAFLAFTLLAFLFLLHFLAVLLTADSAVNADVPAALRTLYQGVSRAALAADTVIGPALGLVSLDSLSDGIWIPWRQVARALLILVGVGAGLSALAGMIVFHRKELALPSR